MQGLGCVERFNFFHLFFLSNSIATPSSVPRDELIADSTTNMHVIHVPTNAIADSTTNMHVIHVPTNASCRPVQVEKNSRENDEGNQEENEFEAEDGQRLGPDVDSTPNLVSSGPKKSTRSRADPGQTTRLQILKLMLSL
jgi:hypothetical protein